MVNIIVGPNNIGKTSTIRNIAKSNHGKCTSNLCGDLTRDGFNLSEKVLELLINKTEIIDYVSTSKNVHSIHWQDTDGVITLSKQAVSVIELLCKDCPIVLIDEPEYSLNIFDLDSVTDALNNCTDDKTIWLTTHNSAFACIENAKYFTIIEGVLTEIERWYNWQY